MEDKAELIRKDADRYGISRLKFFSLGSVLPRAASVPRAWLSVLTLIAAAAVLTGCDIEHDSGSKPNKTVREASDVASSPKLAPFSRAPGAEKIDLKLLRLEQRVRNEDLSLRRASRDAGIVTMGKGMVLDIVTNDIQSDDQYKFRLPGVDVRHFSPRYNRVSVMIRDFDRLHELAALPEVRTIAPEYGAAPRGDARR